MSERLSITRCFAISSLFLAALLAAQEPGLVQLTSNSASSLYPAWSPDGTAIYFASNNLKVPNSYDIWRVAPDGSGPTQITQSPATCCDAGLNRVVPIGNTGDLIVRNTNGLHEWLYLHLSEAPSLPVVRTVDDGPSPYMDLLLTVPGGLSSGWLAVSPDGTNSAWDTMSNYSCPFTTDLHIAQTSSLTGQATTSAGTVLASSALPCGSPQGESIVGLSFSPDGSQLVIARTPAPNYYGYDLEIWTAQGVFVRKLTNNGGGPNPVINWNPSWSKDNRIAFSSNITGQFQIWTMNADGTNLTQETTGEGTTPTWSPDGSRIAFSSNRSGTDQIYSVPTVGAPVITQPPTPPTNSSGQCLSGPNQSSCSSEANVAEPVSTGSGNYYYSHSDFSIPSRGGPLVFARFYNSIDNFSGPLGANWNHGYDILLSQTSGGVATIRWGDGHGETYTLTGGSYVPQPGVYSSLVANTDGTFTLTQKNQMQYHFSSNGKLSFIQDKNGNAEQFAYDGSGNLVTVTTAGGRALSLAYDTTGRITTVTDPMGRVETFSYDGANNLATATDPLGGITTYAYDANHRVTQVTLSNGKTLLQNAYDAQGRVVSQTNGRNFNWQFAYNTPGQGETTITDALGNTTIHAYDSSLRIIGITDAMGHTTSYTYDASNNRMSITNQNGNTTNFAYDVNGNLAGLTDPLSNVTAFTYDAENDLLTVTNPKGKTTNFTYDSHSNLTGIQDALGNKTALVYDSNGELISRTDARGNSTNFQYRSFGDLAGITDALGNSTNLGYDGDGRLVSLTNPSLHTATSAYDALGRLTQASDALGDKTRFSYDAVGNLLSVTDANGHATGYSYDATNNLISVTDALGHITKYTYDADNNRVGFTNAKGNSTSYQFDSLNRLTHAVDPLGFTTAYSFDAVGNVAAVTDAKGQTNKFAYDALNRLISIAYADKKNVAYAYDADGNRTSMIDWTGTTSYIYDAHDRVTSIVFPVNKTVAYSYDANGHRATLTYPGGQSVSFNYDADERLSTVADWLSHVTQYAYDSAGNLLKIQYPNKAHIDFSYDTANRLTSVINTTVGVPSLAFNYALDPAGNRTKVTEAGIPTVYGYDALNQLTSAQIGPLKSSWTYDPVGNRLSESSIFGVKNYTYDISDRLLKAGTQSFVYDADGNQISVTDAFTHLKRTYTFNAANRLVSVDGGLTSSFAYDGDGNRVSQSVAGQKQNYVNDVAAALPIMLQDTYSTGSPSSYVYGLNLIEAFQGRDNDFYQYDGLGSVVQLTDTTGRPELSYFYDAWGNSILPAPPTNPFKFTEQALDAATGLYFVRARYYDPSIGRFIAKDPIDCCAQVGIMPNAFLYAANNPVLLFDPSGLSPLDSFFGFVNEVTSSRPFTVVGGALEIVGGVGTIASGVAQIVATPVTGFTAFTGTASIALGGIAIGQGATNIAAGFQGQPAVSIPQQLSQGVTGSSAFGQLYECSDPVACVQNVAQDWTRDVSKQVQQVGGLLNYLFFVPLPASAASKSGK